MVPGIRLPVLLIQMKNYYSARRYFLSVDGLKIVSRKAPTFSRATRRCAFAAAVFAALALCDALFFLPASALATAGRGRAAFALMAVGRVALQLLDGLGSHRLSS